MTYLQLFDFQLVHNTLFSKNVFYIVNNKIQTKNYDKTIMRYKLVGIDKKLRD